MRQAAGHRAGSHDLCRAESGQGLRRQGKAGCAYLACNGDDRDGGSFGNSCGGGRLHGLRRADLQSSEKETRQKGVGSHRGCCVRGRYSGGHSDRPDAYAALVKQEAFTMDNGRYSIIFSSLTGNTKQLAETIRAALPAEGCDYLGAPETAELRSEMLYVGFWTDKGNADSAALRLLSRLKGKKIFLFGTAGFGGSAAYFKKILDHVRQSIDPSSLVIGEYMCQGKMPQPVRDRYMKMKAQPEHPANIDALIENFDRALSHPDEDDLDRLRKIILG